jgi:hypothetical protein
MAICLVKIASRAIAGLLAILVAVLRTRKLAGIAVDLFYV